MSSILAFLKSSIGKKWIVALTGLVMFGFVVGHMIGNLQIFLGPEAINLYGAMLHAWPEALWIVRSVMLTALVLHVVYSLRVRIESKKARPEKYAVTKRVASSFSSRMMAVSGLLLLGFVIFHLAHYTAHTVDPGFAGMHDEKGRHDVYRMLIEGFSNPLVSIFYIVAMVLLCSHLAHGAWSWMQTLGLRPKKIAAGSLLGARVIAIVLAVGYSAIPVAVLAGMGKDYVASRRAAQLHDTTAKAVEINQTTAKP